MNHTILVVEDDDVVRDFILAVLRNDGNDVLVAASVGEARRLIFARPDAQNLCLVIDVVLQHESGVEFAQELLKRYAQFRVLLISGFTDDVVMTEPAESGRLSFLPKPFTRAELLSALERL